MNRQLFRAGVLFLGLFAVGCSSSQTFDVTVTDKTSDPITVWMTKEKLVAGGMAEISQRRPSNLPSEPPRIMFGALRSKRVIPGIRC